MNGETTPIGVLAIDNYSVASITISFLGLINVEGFDLTLDFNTNERLFHSDLNIALDSNIATDSYETVEISIVDHDNNEKVYDIEALHELGLHNQMAVLNNLSTSSINKNPSLPQVFALHQNYPNPFNPETSIGYDLSEESFVSLAIHDLRGSLIKILLSEKQSSGYKTVKWDGNNDDGQKVSAGLYLYRINTNNFKATKKMVMLK
tara:strand:- start:144 stop:761 length:618 start_codon:yes stop_codon:yes gene_type:complete